MACKLGKRQVQVLVDTGSDRTLVDAKLVQRQQEVEGESVPVKCVHGDVYIELPCSRGEAAGGWDRQGG